MTPPTCAARDSASNNLDEIATHAPQRAEQATLDYYMNDYVDHLMLHLRQILGAGWRVAAPRT
jgi:hypothetical protein